MRNKKKDSLHPNILMLAPLFPPFRGAAASRLHSFAKYWSKLTEVTVIAPQHTHQKEGFRKVIFPLTKQKFDFLHIPRNIKKFFCLARKINSDIVFVSIPTVWPALEGYLLSKRLGVPLILDVRDLPTSTYPADKGPPIRRLFNFFMQSLSQYLLRKSTRIVTVTECVLEQLHEFLITSKFEGYVVRNGSETGLFKNLSFTRKEYDLIYSGALIPVRNPVSMLNFLLCLTEIYPRLKVLFLSDILETALGNQFILSLRQLNLDKNVEFKRMTSLRQIPDYLIKAKLGIDSLMPAVYSHKGVASAKDYEYLTAGLPVVGLLDPDFYVETRRLILDNGAGILDPDPENLARKTAALLKDPKRLHKMSKRAREVGMRFDRKRLAEECYYNVILPAWKEFNAR